MLLFFVALPLTGSRKNFEHIPFVFEIETANCLILKLIDNCPTLQHYEENQGEWLLDEIGDSLEVLLELDELRQQITLEWPEGEKFKL
ncbi:MAG: hypothetical protein JRE64_14620, partial [Deltaproteobacteria bacterium]|nr:hypothetical protein [Deltaproteobacteria bacterium]